jgi:hypothetical protein
LRDWEDVILVKDEMRGIKCALKLIY